ncbi:MAG: hypothetical protein CVU56_14100 [Deltaproteobacteria bacterium HGW-Deltaproteobacteria-14]|jgi:hypothetical protein|nr:MAG: hypothetical protein CVU56_14100 [Deltaproteobacteria bacterium HGW-Deltaproteobacteria-14]
MRKMMPGSLSIAALALALAFTACGEKAQTAAGPADVAKRALEAFKAKDIDALAPLLAEQQRAKFVENAAKIFEADKPNIVAMREWDGETLEVRYAGSEALVHIGPADGRLAVLEMARASDGKWYFDRIRYSSAEDFAAWGSADPNAPVPACNGGGKHVDERPLPAAWAAHGGAPKGATACAFDDASDATTYSFELGSGPDEAAKAWRAHLVASGWAVEDVPDDHGTVFMATQDGTKLRVFTSKHVENLGWTTVTVEATP